jgi:Ni/Co efflux regulator RcnB
MNVKRTPLVVSLSLALLFGSVLPVQAEPDQGHRPQAVHQGHAQGHGQGQKPGQGPQAHQHSVQHQKPSQHPSAHSNGPRPVQHPGHGQAQRLPQNFAPVHQAFHERRAQIGRGPALPRGVHIRKGHPLPRGYGKRLDARSLRGLPSYQGYEWRRVGSDVVLTAVTTGIVYAILQGVLN